MIDALLADVAASGRTTLFEHEGYRIIQAMGIASLPRHAFVPLGAELTEQFLDQVGSDRVVIKLVSPDILHKTEAGGVIFLVNALETVRRGLLEMVRAVQGAGMRTAGALVCEYIPGDSFAAFELFVGLRHSREFGPVLSAGLGGTETEMWAEALRPTAAKAIGSVLLSTPADFLESFKATVAYELLSGRARGRPRAIADEALLRCFEGFFSLGRRYASHEGGGERNLEEFEINPLRVADGRLVALDAVGRLGPAPGARAPRPTFKIAHLLRPRSIALAGVSSKTINLGRIILRNIRRAGFDATRLYIVKAGEERIEDFRCVPDFGRLPEKVDLIIIAVGADQVPHLVHEIIATDAGESVIIIPGGMGETAAGAAREREIIPEIQTGRKLPSGGPIFLGGNCMGVQSRPGRYDTFFIPPGKWDPRSSAAPRRLALISQSGAFLVSRLSNIGCLDPTYVVTVGNQLDLTASDILEFLADDPEIDTFGVYLEGLIDGDGVRLAEAISRIRHLGKTIVVYRAGRTESGRSAVAGHTSVLAGDYAVCAAVLRRAGALVVDTFRQFEHLVELSKTLHVKRIRGLRLGAITNAGFEAVGMGDGLSGSGCRVVLGRLSEATSSGLRAVLRESRLDTLVNVANPLDLTPMAGEGVYERCALLMLQAPEIDALIISLVPLTPNLRTIPEEMSDKETIVSRLSGLFHATDKPVVVVVDAGSTYDPLVGQLRNGGLAVFRSADEAVEALRLYLPYRTKTPPANGRTYPH